MDCKEKLFSLFDGLNEQDQKRAYEFIQSLANEDKLEEAEVLQLFGKHYFVVPD
jgi:hypothetical protein